MKSSQGFVLTGHTRTLNSHSQIPRTVLLFLHVHGRVVKALAFGPSLSSHGHDPAGFKRQLKNESLLFYSLIKQYTIRKTHTFNLRVFLPHLKIKLPSLSSLHWVLVINNAFGSWLYIQTVLNNPFAAMKVAIL